MTPWERFKEAYTYWTASIHAEMPYATREYLYNDYAKARDEFFNSGKLGFLPN